jgi:hypothetical protein
MVVMVKSEDSGERTSDPRPDKDRVVRGKPFLCERYARYLDTVRCETAYVNAMAFKRKGELCFQCPQGKENRKKFAETSTERVIREKKERGGRGREE